MNVNCFQVIEKEQKIISGFKVLDVTCQNMKEVISPYSAGNILVVYRRPK